MLKKVAKGSNMYQGWITHMHTHLGGECSHRCSYCLSGETLILMSDGSQKLLKELVIGDEIIGAVKQGRYMHYVKTLVLAKWKSIKEAILFELNNGTKIECSADHKWHTTRGWLFTKREDKKRRNLGLASRISCIANYQKIISNNEMYKRGYLCGAILGDGHLAIHEYFGRGKVEKQYQFRLACKDKEIIQTVKNYLYEILKITCQEFGFPMKDRKSSKWIDRPAIRTSTQNSLQKISLLLTDTKHNDKDWARGFLAGIFDAEGSSSDVIRISNTDESILTLIEQTLKLWGFNNIREKVTSHCDSIRLLGGLKEIVRFFQITNPKIVRKFNIVGRQVKNSVKVKKIISTHKETEMYDITTGTGDFIANGLLSHNCYVQNNHFGVNPRYKGEVKFLEQELLVDYGQGKVIFEEHMNDMFAEGVQEEDIHKIFDHCYKYPKNSYVFQTKNPVRAWAFKNCFSLDTSLIGTTIETNRTEVLMKLSKAPSPDRRYEGIKLFSLAGFKTFITIEPIMDFDVDIFSEWIILARPRFVTIGADSKECNLPEPPAQKVRQLITELRANDIVIKEKWNLDRVLRRK